MDSGTGKRGEAGRQLPRADSCPLSLLPLLASRGNVMTGCQQPLWARRSPCSGGPPPARTGRWHREMEAASAGARPAGQVQYTARLCDPSAPDTFWTKQNWLASERKISQSSPLREEQTTGRPPSHNGQGGLVSKAPAAQLGTGRCWPCTDPSLAWMQNPARHGPLPAERQGVQGS